MSSYIQDSKGGIFLSVKPRFSRALLNGTKSVELRRRAPSLFPGSLVAVYESSPTKALSGFLQVSRVIDGSPKAVWSKAGRYTMITKAEFDNYFAGTDKAYAIEVRDYFPLSTPIQLGLLRKECPGFSPPQSFRYLTRLPQALSRMLDNAYGKATAQ